MSTEGEPAPAEVSEALTASVVRCTGALVQRVADPALLLDTSAFVLAKLPNLTAAMLAGGQDDSQAQLVMRIALLRVAVAVVRVSENAADAASPSPKIKRAKSAVDMRYPAVSRSLASVLLPNCLSPHGRVRGLVLDLIEALIPNKPFFSPATPAPSSQRRVSAPLAPLSTPGGGLAGVN